MRIAAMGSDSTLDRVKIILSLSRFMKEHDIKSPTIIIKDSGDFARLVAMYAYERGWDIIALPCATMTQMNTFISCTDRMVSFVEGGDVHMMSFLRKARKSGVGVVYYGMTPD